MAYAAPKYTSDLFQTGNEDMFGYMQRLAAQRASGILGGGGLFYEPPVSPATTAAITAVPTAATVASPVSSSSSSGSTGLPAGMVRVAGDPLLDANGNPIIGRDGKPVLGTMVINAPAVELTPEQKQAAVASAANRIAGNAATAGGLLKGGAQLVGASLGLPGLLAAGAMDYFQNKDDIAKVAEYLGVDPDTLSEDAIGNKKAMEYALEQGFLGPNMGMSTMDTILGAATNPLNAAVDWARNTPLVQGLFGNLLEPILSTQLDAAIMQEAANKADRFSLVPDSMMFDNSVFTPAVTTAAPQYMDFGFNMQPVTSTATTFAAPNVTAPAAISDSAEQALSRALATGADAAAGSSSSSSSSSSDSTSSSVSSNGGNASRGFSYGGW